MITSLKTNLATQRTVYDWEIELEDGRIITGEHSEYYDEWGNYEQFIQIDPLSSSGLTDDEIDTIHDYITENINKNA